MRGNLLVAMALAIGVSGTATATPFYSSGYSPYGLERTARQPGPAAILRRGLDSLISFADRENEPSNREIGLFLEQEIAPYFDFAYMARWVAGQAWQNMNMEQRARLEQRLAQKFLGTLAERLTAFGGQQVRVLRPRARKGNEVDVAVAVQNPGGYPARLNFRFYRSKQGWKVFDVAANGNSAVAYYRQNFKRMMRRGMAAGPGFPGGR